MQIQVTAIHREGLSGVWTPQTLWPSAAPTKVEVLDQDESPPRPPGVATTGMQIGGAELAVLRNTPGLVVSGIDQTNAVEMTAQLAEARKAHAEEVARLSGIIEQQTIEITRLSAMESRVKEQEQTIADLRARLASKAAPVQSGQPQPVGRRS